MSLEYLLTHPILQTVPKPVAILLVAYLLIKVLDFVTGLLKTWKGVTNYESGIMRDGIIRWIGELVGIFFVLLLDWVLGLNFYLTGFTLSLFVYKEGGSIAENLSAIGVEMPGIVEDKLDSFNRAEEKKEDE